MPVFIVENCKYDDTELEVFTTAERAAASVREYYTDHFTELFEGYDGPVEYLLNAIKEDLENLRAELPFIQDVMYIRTATLHE